ncbi:MAG: hypothetical protein ACJ74G_24545, partial [Blastocatellia bacterium]
GLILCVSICLKWPQLGLFHSFINFPLGMTQVFRHSSHLYRDVVWTALLDYDSGAYLLKAGLSCDKQQDENVVC